MPNPATGAGADVTTGLRKYSWALYLSDAAGAGVAPPAKLFGAEPASPWVRQGRIAGDQFSWNIPDPGYLEGRAGATNVLKYRIINQAEIPILTAPLDESDAESLNRLRGGAAGAATYLSSGAYTGYSFSYRPGQFYKAKVLLIGTSLPFTDEKHFFAANSFVTFKPSTQPTHDGVDVSVAMGADTSNYAFYQYNWA